MNMMNLSLEKCWVISIFTKRELKIEGLNSEKRMIQSTDRKLFDMNRQSEIDKEISQLEK